MEYCNVCGRPKYISTELSYFDICKCKTSINSGVSATITLNGQSEEIRLLREISYKLDQLIELLGKI